MKVITYKLMKDFIKENETLLFKDESINQLLIFNTLNKKALSANDELHFGKIVNNNNEVCLLFLNNEPYNLLAYCPNETLNVDAVTALVEYLVTNNIKIYGINASKCICDTFIRYYKKYTKATFREHLAMDIMEVSQLNDIILPSGNFRQATLDDLTTLSKWYCQFALEATNEVITLKNASIYMEKKLTDGLVYLFENSDGIPVSMAATTRKLENSVSINLVYTDDVFRGQNYGTAVVFNLSKLLLNSGYKFCSLFVDKSNAVSNKLYRKLGYKILDNNYDFRINH